MRKSLQKRIRDAGDTLNNVNRAIARHSGTLGTKGEKKFVRIANYASDVEHWLDLLTARDTARALMEGLELQVDGNDTVLYGSTRAQFQTVRLLATQSYLAAQWALADCVAGMAGYILCVRGPEYDPKKPPQLLSHFLGDESKSSGIWSLVLIETFGYSIAISYALRNHFLHDGAGAFFEGPNAVSAFKISEVGWRGVEERVKTYKLSSGDSRLNSE